MCPKGVYALGSHGTLAPSARAHNELVSPRHPTALKGGAVLRQWRRSKILNQLEAACLGKGLRLLNGPIALVLAHCKGASCLRGCLLGKRRLDDGHPHKVVHTRGHAVAREAAGEPLVDWDGVHGELAAVRVAGKWLLGQPPLEKVLQLGQLPSGGDGTLLLPPRCSFLSCARLLLKAHPLCLGPVGLLPRPPQGRIPCPVCCQGSLILAILLVPHHGGLRGLNSAAAAPRQGRRTAGSLSPRCQGL
mmetsp:Transcript_21119/g.58590  ORF Transcript_21119/g.58590 Transcript_21119/m.58590 type:complete len:247 (+) Transcript_21119:152-892(+)